MSSEFSFYTQTKNKQGDDKGQVCHIEISITVESLYYGKGSCYLVLYSW